MDWIDNVRKQRELEYEPKYGPIQPGTDSRCFRREMIEELIDSLNYAQWPREKGEINSFNYRQIRRTIRASIGLIENACGESWWWKLEAQKPTEVRGRKGRSLDMRVSSLQ